VLVFSKLRWVKAFNVLYLMIYLINKGNQKNLHHL
jgi:hypothetical protein